MANRKKLKKQIQEICSELLAETVAVSLYSSTVPKEDIAAQVKSILLINDDYVRRVSHIEPGMQPKTYFKNLTDGFYKQVMEVIDQLNNLH